MIEIPRWRFEPELVWLRCQIIKKHPHTDKEFIVQFKTNGEQFVSFVPSRFVNLEKSGIGACIIADVSGGVLVEIPAETLTSGARMVVWDGERDAVLMPFEQV